MPNDAPEVGFLGAEIETDPERLQAEVAVLGIPHGSAYPDPGLTAGCAAAPAAVRRRAARLARFRGHWDFDTAARFFPIERSPRVIDAGDVPGSAADGAGNGARAEAAVRAILERGAMPLVLGGDDSTTIPFLRALSGHGPITVVQVDAHLDFRDEVDGVRDGYSSPMRRASEMPHVAAVIQVGLRGVGSARPHDVADARAAGHRLVTAAELRERGVGPAVLEGLPADARVVLAFDADGLDPSVCPAVSGLAPGGLSYAEAVALITGIGPRLGGAIFTELVPERDVNEIGTLAIARLACISAAARG
jgi:agmatinase